jgi:hypothetical protein
MKLLQLALSALLFSLLIAANTAGAQAGPRYDLVLQKASHNSYARDESLFDQLVFHRVRSLELDIWQSENWKVGHNGSGEPNSPNCTPLTKCLAILAAFHKATPQHEVVTVWLEPTDYEPNTFAPLTHPIPPFPSQALDKLLTDSLGRLALFAPADLMSRDCQRGHSANLATLVAACGFPQTNALRGRFIFVLMDANDGEHRALVEYLGNAAPTSRLAFVAPDPSSPMACVGCSVFFNENGGVKPGNPFFGFGPTVRNCCSGASDDDCSKPSNADWNTMIAANTQHVGTNCINYQTSPWAVTHNQHGWPFHCVGGEDCSADEEPNDIVGVRVSSGDLDGKADDFGFAFQKLAEGPQQWQMDAFVSSAGSSSKDSSPATIRTNEWAKGCLMARQSLEPDSAYFAVCRPDRHNLRVQYRLAKGQDTTKYDSSIDPRFNASFVRLVARPSAGGTCFSGLFGDGASFPDGKSACLDGEFLFRGLAVSSHGDPFDQMLFGHITVSSAESTVSLTSSSLFTLAPIGIKKTGRIVAFDGPIGAHKGP